MSIAARCSLLCRRAPPASSTRNDFANLNRQHRSPKQSSSDRGLLATFECVCICWAVHAACASCLSRRGCPVVVTMCASNYQTLAMLVHPIIRRWPCLCIQLSDVGHACAFLWAIRVRVTLCFVSRVQQRLSRCAEEALSEPPRVLRPPTDSVNAILHAAMQSSWPCTPRWTAISCTTARRCTRHASTKTRLKSVSRSRTTFTPSAQSFRCIQPTHA